MSAHVVDILSRTVFVTGGTKRSEWPIFLVIALCGYVFGQSIYLQHLDQAGFYQSHFLPPLHFACTGTFDSFRPSQAVLDFLSSPRATFVDCQEVAALPKLPWDGFGNGVIFLFGLAGILWRIFGIAWTSLSPIAGVMTAALTVSAYGLFRVFCRYPLVALVATFAFVNYPSVVGQIMHLRDFSKAPFIVAALAMLAAAVLQPRTLRGIFVLAAATGAVIALALGFRPDVIAILPIAVAAPVFMLGSGTWKNWARRSAGLWLGLAAGYMLVRMATIAITPPISTSGNFLSHVFMLGFAEPFTAGTQGMADASYRVLSPYLDRFLFGLVSVFEGRTLAKPDMWFTAAYDREALDMLASAFMLVPNDAFMRIFYTAHTLHNWVPLIWGPRLVAVTCLLWLARRKAFLFLALGFAFLTSVASLQMEIRHVFFFGIFGLGMGCLLVDAAVAALSAPLPDQAMLRLRQAASSLFVVLVVLAAMFGIISSVTLNVQEERIAESLQRYQSLGWRPITFTQNGQTLEPTGTFSLPKSVQLDFDDQRYTGLFARLTLRPKTDGTACGAGNLSFNQVYKYVDSELAFRPWAIPEGTVRELYFPMIYDQRILFTNLHFDGDLTGCTFEWHIVEAGLPPRTLPLEMIIVDGQIQKAHRGDWNTLLRRFLFE